MNASVSRFFKIQSLWTASVAFALLMSCITVNVNFPESAVQRAADDFVQDLYKKEKHDAPAEEKKEEPSKEEVKKSKKKKVSAIDAAFLSAVAFAQELNMSTKKSLEIKARMQKRVSEISSWKSKGVLGEAQDGNLVLKEPKKAGENLKQLKTIVDDENEDRDQLYEEIQSANSISDRKQTRIRKTFSNSFQKNSPAGTWVEGADGNWTQK